VRLSNDPARWVGLDRICRSLVPLRVEGGRSRPLSTGHSRRGGPVKGGRALSSSRLCKGATRGSGDDHSQSKAGSKVLGRGGDFSATRRAATLPTSAPPTPPVPRTVRAIQGIGWNSLVPPQPGEAEAPAGIVAPPLPNGAFCAMVFRRSLAMPRPTSKRNLCRLSGWLSRFLLLPFPARRFLDNAVRLQPPRASNVAA